MAEKFAWTPLNCPCTRSSHVCGKNTDLYSGTCSNIPSVLHHLPSWSKTHPFNLSELHGEQLSASSKNEGTELSQPELNTLIKLLLSNYFISQRRAATAQKQEGNALPYLSLKSSCPVKHKKHKSCVRESSRLM